MKIIQKSEMELEIPDGMIYEQFAEECWTDFQNGSEKIIFTVKKTGKIFGIQEWINDDLILSESN